MASDALGGNPPRRESDTYDPVPESLRPQYTSHMGDGLTNIQRFRPETQGAFEAVVQAHAIAVQSIGTAGISSKGGRNLVTTADIAVEDSIRDRLTSAFSPPVVGEERGGEAPGDGSAYWLVDPICGTRNFASGIPLYCVNLALVEDGEVTVAVVGDPSTGEIALAERGGGAWTVKGDTVRRLAADDESRTIVVENGKSTGARREHATRVTAAIIRADRWYCRSLGSTISAAYLAAGRIAAYVEVWATALHIAAGSLLIAEAGGVLSDIEGRPWSIGTDSLVASGSPELHDGLLALIHATSTRADDERRIES